MRRRGFLGASAAASLGLCHPLTVPGAEGAGLELPELDEFVRRKMARDHIPGVAGCVVDHRRIRWQGCYGWADLERRVPMTLDSLLNICSISKTFTATAALQLVDAGLLDPERPVDEYLPFPVRNPGFPGVPVTARQLLLHTSSLRDGLAYSAHYACGDPRMSLGTWIREYLAPGGRFYDAEENFHPWPPGERSDYNNVAFGLLGHLVEVISGIPFPVYCRRNVFAPLGMRDTSWMLAGIDPDRHAVPYTWVAGGRARGPDWGGQPLGVIRQDGPTHSRVLEDGYQANCAYNHPNYPDGFLRTSVAQLSRYLRVYLNDGAFDGVRVLAPDTARGMFEVQYVHDGYAYGLPWYAHDARRIGEMRVWGHGGSDPGANTDIRLLPGRGVGAIVFANTNGIEPETFTYRFLEAALGMA